jgi:hypothetical protein
MITEATEVHSHTNQTNTSEQNKTYVAEKLRGGAVM